MNVTKTILKFFMVEKGMINCLWEGPGSFTGEAGTFVIVKDNYFLFHSL